MKTPARVPHKISKKFAGRNLLAMTHPNVGAHLPRITFVDYLRDEWPRKFTHDTRDMSRKLIAAPEMSGVVTARIVRRWVTNNYPPAGRSYWKALGKILFLGYGVHLQMRQLANDTGDRELLRRQNEARRKLDEKDRLMKRYKREAARRKRWGQG